MFHRLKTDKILILLIFAMSVYLRLDAYFINNSFFTDEILLAQNIFERSYAGLFFPLGYFQSAPCMFLVLSKFITGHIGINELAFRFLPLVTSLLSVYLFCLLSKEVFKTNFAKVMAIITFGISYQLLFYTQVFKQYSSDVLISILILLVSQKVFKSNLSGIKYFSLGFLWVFCILFSFPAYIVLGAFYFTCIFKRKFKALLSLILPAFVSSIYYVINLGMVRNSAYLTDYWKKGFEIFSGEIYKINFEFLFHYYSFPLLFFVLMIVGLYYLYKRNKLLFVQFAGIFIITLLAAYLKIYPFERRLTLFLLPVLIIISIFPLDNLKKDWKSYVIFTVTIMFLGCGYFNFVKEYVSGNVSYLRQDVKPMFGIVLMKKDSPLYLYYGSLTAYNYYSKLYDLPPAIYGTYPADEKLSEKYLISDLEHLKAGSYYLLFVKGTWTYDNDITTAKNWIKHNAHIENEYHSKSVWLVKISK